MTPAQEAKRLLRLRGLPDNEDERIAQIIANLLSNAVKFTDSGYVRLTAAALAGVCARPRSRASRERSGP